MIYKIPVGKLRKTRLSKIAPFCLLDLFQHHAFLAGGSLRTLIADESVADFDVFFRFLIPIEQEPIEGEVVIPKYANVEAVKRTLEKEKFRLIFSCPEGKMFSYQKGDIKIQLILEVSAKPENLIQTFDFGACTAAFDGEFVYFSKQFVRDVKTKRLSINLVEYPVATIKRLVKYCNKGYNINDACLQFMQNVAGKSFDMENLRLYID